MPRVIAINGSARMKKGYTEKILIPFISGMEEAGASTDIIYARQLKIKPCTGTFYCWYDKPGDCIMRDDMQMLYPRLKEADILVIASPVYIPLPGEMQNFINRLCPLIEPILTNKKGRTRARFHADVNIKQIVLVSTCGWWERGNFGTLLRIIREFAEDADIQFAGAILRPHASLMDREESRASLIYDSCNKAGYQLIKKGRISRKLLKIISEPLVTEDELRQLYNEEYEQALS